MALSKQQEFRALQRTLMLGRDLYGIVQNGDELDAKRAYSTELDAFLDPLFTSAQWSAIRATIMGWVTTLRDRARTELRADLDAIG